jgi:zinc protease
METLFQLIYLYFVQPRRDSSAFLAMRSQFMSFAEDRKASPEAAFRDTVQVTLAQNHPRERPLTPALVEAVDLDEALAFYRDRFADASDFTFFFVGNLDLDSIRPLVETYLGGLPSIDRVETWRDVGIDPPTGVIQKTVYRGMEPKSQTEFFFTGPFEDSRMNRYVLGSLAAALQIRLREVMREDLGGTYSVGVRGNSSITPDTSYGFGISFGAAPERLEELAQVVLQEIATFTEAGPADSTVLKVQEMQRRGRETNLRQNGYWLNQLVAANLHQADPSNILTYERLIDLLTPEMIRDAARRYLRTDNYIRVSLYPETRP